jgi:hypothetical protein
MHTHRLTSIVHGAILHTRTHMHACFDDGMHRVLAHVRMHEMPLITVAQI